MKLKSRQSGVSLIAVIAIIIVLSVIGSVVGKLYVGDVALSTEHRSSDNAFLLAEAGLQAGKSQVSNNCDNPYTAAVTTTMAGKGDFSYTITDTNPAVTRNYLITASGYDPDIASANYTRTIQTTVVCSPSADNSYSSLPVFGANGVTAIHHSGMMTNKASINQLDIYNNGLCSEGGGGGMMGGGGM
ncbi:MAG: hypothetical protein GXP22_09845, partial [Gammaproteobacteria bacterium]|nr:hypothetical protein [Gammaproteobacteria bacterium]